MQQKFLISKLEKSLNDKNTYSDNIVIVQLNAKTSNEEARPAQQLVYLVQRVVQYIIAQFLSMDNICRLGFSSLRGSQLRFFTLGRAGAD